MTLGEVLMGDYSVACFDEISNGLDSSSALDIIRTIRAWAKNFSYTCAISLLQPAPEVFALFDEVGAGMNACVRETIIWPLWQT